MGRIAWNHGMGLESSVNMSGGGGRDRWGGGGDQVAMSTRRKIAEDFEKGHRFGGSRVPHHGMGGDGKGIHFVGFGKSAEGIEQLSQIHGEITGNGRDALCQGAAEDAFGKFQSTGGKVTLADEKEHIREIVGVDSQLVFRGIQ